MVGGIFGGSGAITVINSRSRCPACGNFADILDGAYRFSNDVLVSFSGPAYSVEILRAFVQVLERAKRDNLPFEAVKQEADKISPHLGSVIETLRGTPHPMLMAIFLLILITLKNCHYDLKGDVNQLLFQATHQGEMFVPPSSKAYPHNVLARPVKGQNLKKENKGGGTDTTGNRAKRKDANPPDEI